MSLPVNDLASLAVGGQAAVGGKPAGPKPPSKDTKCLKTIF